MSRSLWQWTACMICAAFLTTALSSCGDDEALTLPVSCFNPNQVLAVEDGFEFEFSNCSSSADSYMWDFGDGNTSTEESPTHVYEQRGEYTVTLTSTNTRGSTETTEIVQFGHFKVGSFTYSIEQDVLPNEVDFNCSGIEYRIAVQTTTSNTYVCASAVDDSEVNFTCVDIADDHFIPTIPILIVEAASQCGQDMGYEYLAFSSEEEDFEVNISAQSRYENVVFSTPDGGRLTLSLDIEFMTE